jgi:hypothetical protein
MDVREGFHHPFLKANPLPYPRIAHSKA